MQNDIEYVVKRHAKIREILLNMRDLATLIQSDLECIVSSWHMDIDWSAKY